MNGRTKPFLLVGGACLLVGLWATANRRGPSPGEPVPPSDRPSDAPSASEKPASPTPPRRAAIPRPRPRARPAANAPSASAPAASPAAEEAPADDTAEPRGGVDPSIPLTPEGISSVADEMRGSIADCVQAWAAEDPSIQGQVLLAFQLGPEGVQNAWVAEHERVPAPVLGCFSAAVYEQDWPAAPGGVEITIPFEVEEEGLAPPDPDARMEDKRERR